MKKLTPLTVPWAVSPSMPDLRMICEENGQTLVQFFALFGFEPLVENKALGESIGIDTRGLRVDPSLKHGRYQLISLIFKNAGWILRSPQHSDREVVEESLFDWSDVRGVAKDGQDPFEWNRKCLQEWCETKISPDPAVYIVSNSDWHVGEAEKWGLKHYLVLGDSSYIEVLAQDVEWFSEGVVLGW